MNEIRLAKKGDMVRQKEIWRLCFGDSDRYIDFYYANRYQEDETMVLLEGGEIVSMLTMLPIKTIAANKRSYDSTMFYAIATHPQYQNRGLAAKLIDFAHQYLSINENTFSLLVPSEPQLFGFYSHQGYQDGFYIREILFTREMIENWDVSAPRSCLVAQLSPADYNRRRNEQLRGRLYIAYTDKDMAYQAKLAQQLRGDLFGIAIDEVQGCVALERVNSDRVFIRELLVPERLIPAAVKQIAQLLPAREYLLRTPACTGPQLEGTLRPFAMIRAIQKTDLQIAAEDRGYLGFAFN